jgi:hypothetical protein
LDSGCFGWNRKIMPGYCGLCRDRGDFKPKVCVANPQRAAPAPSELGDSSAERPLARSPVSSRNPERSQLIPGRGVRIVRQFSCRFPVPPDAPIPMRPESTRSIVKCALLRSESGPPALH